MPYLRLSLMKPMAGHEDEVEGINRELVQINQGDPGCLASYLIAAMDGSAEVGRASVWASEADADRVANEPRPLSLRSQLHLLIQAGHAERSFAAS
ncbi:MAG: hypothetical protein Q8P22_08095 [Chloroflexota bacterium]|nr:hypothetical protein [Chloroflexota bacterium]